jgi:hypothetical protein
MNENINSDAESLIRQELESNRAKNYEEALANYDPKAKMKPIRQGDVILIPTEQTQGKLLTHLTLAEGEVTGHKHRISEGQAELYQTNDTLYLKILSKTATLSHEEHQTIFIPGGNWMVRIQREYEPRGWRYVAD